jgi:L-lactate dehydrogenase
MGGVVVVGAVGAATSLALVERGVCRDLILIDKNTARARGVALGAPLSPAVTVSVGDYDALAGAEVVILTAAVNEKAGGATDRSDTQGRLRLLDTNADIFREIVPQVVKSATHAVLMVVTDPPDPLADLTRALARHERVLSTGTLLDSLRFRTHLAQRLGVRPRDVDALVVGEHGVTEVLV